MQSRSLFCLANMGGINIRRICRKILNTSHGIIFFRDLKVIDITEVIDELHSQVVVEVKRIMECLGKMEEPAPSHTTGEPFGLSTTFHPQLSDVSTVKDMAAEHVDHLPFNSHS